MERKPYPSDLTDAQWRMIAPLIPDAKPGGRPRRYEMRQVVNGPLYLAREGCSWPALPHDLPHRRTCYNFLRRFEADGTWDALVGALRVEVRTKLGRDPRPAAPASTASRPRPPTAGPRSASTAPGWCAAASVTSSPTRQVRC